MVIPPYAQVHLNWTIPPAMILYALGKRIRTSREVIKTNALITIAVIATIPWDSYLIRNSIWQYPPHAVFGPTLWSIPLEELFFFFIQTYLTASLYALLSRPVVHAVLLSPSNSTRRLARWAGTLFLLATTLIAAQMIAQGGQGTYLGLILVWVSPFLALIWFLASDHILALPHYACALPIAIPTLFLWILDSVALRRGTWVINSGTKFGLSYLGLEIEEAIFFLLTNVLIVFGLAACDKSLAIHDVYPDLYPLRSSQFPSPVSVMRSILTSPDSYPPNRLSDLKVALSLLKDKSKSFYTASMIFEGKLKLDLLSLYAFCRVADDLVDEAPTPEAASDSIALISSYLDILYSEKSSSSNEKLELLLLPLAPSTRSAFNLLATLNLPREPLEELLEGFRTDLRFSPSSKRPLPIRTDADLVLYSQNVASSVAELCVRLVWLNEGNGETTVEERIAIIQAAREMGVALQLVNICRDVPADLTIGRMYLPGIPLDAATTTKTVERRRLLALGRSMALASEGKIELLPIGGKKGIRAACAVYLQIGEAVERALNRGDFEARAGVSKMERFAVAWSALGKA